MLSESASVGAKVLGKLAGTEIVDKSISEVNKKTHQTRNDIAYADKQIGEIDVSLTEYFDLDRFDAELKIAEAAFTKLKEDQSRHVALTALMNSYQLNTEQRIKYYDEVERLAGVVVASVSLGIAEREQAKKEKLEDLNTGFWKAVQDQNEPLRVIRITRNLEDLQADLKEVEADVIRYDALLGFQYGYINLQETIRRTSALVVKLDQAVGLSFMLDEAEKDTQEQHDYVPKLSTILEADVDDKFYIADEKAHKIIDQALQRISSMGKVHATITPDRVDKRQNGRRSKEDEDPMFTLTAQDLHGVIVDDTYGYPTEREREPEKDLHRGSPDTTEQSARGKGGREYHEKRYGKDAPLFPIVEATKAGIAVGRYGDAINIAYPESNTRRGRVGKEIAQSLLTGCSQVVICDKKGGENDT